MELYTKAYCRYIEKCEEFGIQAIDLMEFMRNLTKEQIEMIVSH